MHETMRIFLLRGLIVLCLIIIQIDCKKTKTKIAFDPINCCKHPDGDNATYQSCAKETGYKLHNSGEQPKADAIEDQIVAGTCYGKCIFDKLNFMNGAQLDMEAVTKHYTALYKSDPEYTKTMVSSFGLCRGKSQDELARFVSNQTFTHTTKKLCDPKPSVIWACVLRQFFHNCPTDHWLHTNECNAIHDFKKNRDSALVTN